MRRIKWNSDNLLHTFKLSNCTILFLLQENIRINLGTCNIEREIVNGDGEEIQCERLQKSILPVLGL